MSLRSSLSMALLLAVGLTGCSNQSSDSAKGSASTETTVLRFSHFWPATSSISTEVFEPWAKQIEEESNGRLKIEMYPSAGLIPILKNNTQVAPLPLSDRPN